MYSTPERILNQDIGGICHDVVWPLRDQYIARRKLDNTVCSTLWTIRLVVFDLDGVLVESRDLHYEVLNRALEEEAGAQYVISRDEHEHEYDGLSTNQKLQMLGVAKGLPRDLFKKVWSKKQEYTESLVKEILFPTDTILNAIATLKRMCLPGSPGPGSPGPGSPGSGSPGPESSCPGSPGLGGMHLVSGLLDTVGCFKPSNESIHFHALLVKPSRPPPTTGMQEVLPPQLCQCLT